MTEKISIEYYYPRNWSPAEGSQHSSTAASTICPTGIHTENNSPWNSKDTREDVCQDSKSLTENSTHTHKAFRKGSSVKLVFEWRHEPEQKVTEEDTGRENRKIANCVQIPKVPSNQVFNDSYFLRTQAFHYRLAPDAWKPQQGIS